MTCSTRSLNTPPRSDDKQSVRKNLFARIWHAVRMLAGHVRDRRQVLELSTLNEHRLRDLGLRRDHVQAVMSFELSRSLTGHLAPQNLHDRQANSGRLNAAAGCRRDGVFLRRVR